MAVAAALLAMLAGCAPPLRPEAALPGMPQHWPADAVGGPAAGDSLNSANCANPANPANFADAADAGGVAPSRGEALAATCQAALPDWRSYFVDPALRTLIERALMHNADLKLALARLQEARAGYLGADAALWPQVDLAATAGRSLVPGDLNLTGRPLRASQYELGLQLGGWELDLWGRVRSLRGAALENWLAGAEAQQAVALLLVAQVADGYLALRELDERIALAQRAIASRNASWRMFKRRYEVGSSSRLEQVQAETLLTQAEALGAQLAQARAARAHALAELVGDGESLDPPFPLSPAAPVRGGQAYPPVPIGSADAKAPAATPDTATPSVPAVDAPGLLPLAPGLPSSLLLRRPDLRAAEHQLRAARGNVDAARAAYFPRIGLTAALGTASAELDGLFAAGSRAWSVAPAMAGTVFDHGRRDAGLAQAEARRDSALANYQKRVQAAFREVADGLSAQHSLAAQLEIAGRACAAQTERARLAQLRYARGAATFLEVLDAERELLAVEQQRLQVRRALQSNQVALYVALGGGAAPAATAPNVMKEESR